MYFFGYRNKELWNLEQPVSWPIPNRGMIELFSKCLTSRILVATLVKLVWLPICAVYYIAFVLDATLWLCGMDQNRQCGCRWECFSSVHVLQGCYEKAREFVGEQADILVGCAFTFAFSVVGIQYLDFFVTISVSD